jgi:hypothetical protein
MHSHPSTGPIAEGWIVAARAVECPELGEDDSYDIHACGLCGDYVWVSRKTMMFHSMRPDVPIFCCCCTGASTELLKRMLPGLEFGRGPVPDLGRLGVLN